MAINFPNSPANGDTHVSGEKTFNYDAAKGVWNLEGNLKVALDITSTPPSSPSHGDLWMDETTGDMYFRNLQDYELGSANHSPIGMVWGGIHLLKSGYRQFAYSYALSPLRGLRWPYNLV